MTRRKCPPKLPQSFRRALASGLVIAMALGPTAAPALDFGDILKNVTNQPGVQNILNGQQPKRNAKTDPDTPEAAAAAGDAVGSITSTLCNMQLYKSGTSFRQSGRALCSMGTTMVTDMTKMLGAKIADGLREEEQRKVLVAAAESLKTGEPQVVDLPDSNQSVAIDPVGQPTTREVQVQVLVDAAAVRSVAPLRVIGEPREVRTAGKLRGAPALDAASVGSVKAGETVHVIGQLDGGETVLVSKWILEDGLQQPMGTGYMQAVALKPSTNKAFPAEADFLKKVPQTKLVTVTATLQCHAMDFKKTDVNGVRAQATSYLCVGPDGSTTSA